MRLVYRAVTPRQAKEFSLIKKLLAQAQILGSTFYSAIDAKILYADPSSMKETISRYGAPDFQN